MKRRQKDIHGDVHMHILDIVTRDARTSTVITLFGVDRTGASVKCDVTGYKPFMYLAVPDDFKVSDINGILKGSACEGKLAKKQYLFGFHFFKKHQVVQIHSDTQRELHRLRDSLYNKRTLQYGQGKSFGVELYESDLSLEERFFKERDTNKAQWVLIKGGTYDVLDANSPYTRSSTQYNIACSHNNLHFLSNDDLPIHNTMVFDIETLSKSPHDADAKVITIGLAIFQENYQVNVPLKLFLITTKRFPSIEGVEVLYAPGEKCLLKAFLDLVRSYDVDVTVGHNSHNFDFYYLYQRAKVLGLSDYELFGKNFRKSRVLTRIGNMKASYVTTPGRVQLDTCLIARISPYPKLSKYDLRTVAAAVLKTPDERSIATIPPHLLTPTKDDLRYKDIPIYYASNDEKKLYKLGFYNMVDVVVTMRIYWALKMFVDTLGLARVRCCTIADVFNRGQLHKSRCLVLQFLNRKSMIFNRAYVPYSQNKHDNKTGNKGKGYVGGEILGPKVGRYKDSPISVLDYKSMYPSIQIDMNICSSTYVALDSLTDEEKAQLETIPHKKSLVNNVAWVTDERVGIFPLIQKVLRDERGATKKKMKDPTIDAQTYMNLNSKQLALKIAGNSLYGAFGFKNGALSCQEIASEITATGRYLLRLAKEIVEAKFPTSEVIYGDTDSVMCNWHLEKLRDRHEKLVRSEENANAAVKCVNDVVCARVGPYSGLENEKHYSPFVIFKAKSYFGFKYVGTKAVGLDISGMNAKCNYCQFLRNLEYNIVDLLCKYNEDGAKAYVHSEFRRLMAGDYKVEEMALIKKLGHDIENYQSATEHVAVATRMRERNVDPAECRAGALIQYCYVQQRPAALQKKALAREIAEDVQYIKEHQLPLDLLYYFTMHFKNPLCEILGLISSDPYREFFLPHVQKLQQEKMQMRSIQSYMGPTTTGRTSDRKKSDEPPKKKRYKVQSIEAMFKM